MIGGEALALSRLNGLRVGIVDADIPNAQVVRRILGALGVTRTHACRDSAEALTLAPHLDVLIADMAVRPHGGEALLRKLRAPESPRRTLPVIATAWGSAAEAFAGARDAGADEFLLRPYSIRSLSQRFLSIIDRPRPFVVSHRYAGPDRRRIGKPPAGVRERRGSGKVVPLRPDELHEVFLDATPRMLMPDYALKRRLEAAASSLKGIETILPAAAAEEHAQEYAEWLMADAEVIRQAARHLEQAPGEARTYLQRVEHAAQSIRARALAAGYVTAAQIAVDLQEFCTSRYRQDMPGHAVVVGKYAEALYAMFMQRLTGAENQMAQAIAEELRALVRKYAG